MARQGVSWQNFDERHPFGKGSTIISEDNYTHAQARRAARQRIQQGRGTPADYEFVQGAEALIQGALAEKMQQEEPSG